MQPKGTKFVILIAGLIAVLSLSMVSTMPIAAVMSPGYNLRAQGPTNTGESISEQPLPQMASLPNKQKPHASQATTRLPKSRNIETATGDRLRDLPQDLVLWGDIAGDNAVVETSSEAVVKIYGDNRVEFALQATCEEALPQIRNFLRANHIPVIHEFPSINILTIKVPVGWIDGISNRFLKDAIIRPDIEYIGPNTYVHTAVIPNDPDYILQWGHQRIGMPDAWDVELGSHDVKIAVIDTGIDYTHPDLSNNYVSGGYDWVNLDTDPFDDAGHGTHCAGIIAAVINNSLGVAGVANLSIMAEKSFDSGGWGSDVDGAAAIDHAVSAGADILSCSWSHHDVLHFVTAAVERAVAAGVLVVAAAANNGNEFLRWPACLPGVMAVGATNGLDELAGFSSYGMWVDVTAPGVDILSTFPDNQYGYASGTSMATPYVAGLAGLLMSHYPSYSADQIQWLICTTATDLGAPGKDRYFGWGRINASSALNGLPSHNLRAWGFGFESEGGMDGYPSVFYPGEVPDTVSLGFGTKVYGYAVNLGLVSESDVNLRLYVNGTLAASTIASSLNGGESLTLPFRFQPTKPGVYNITIMVDTVVGEGDVTDNTDEHWISVTLCRDYLMEPREAVWLDAVTYGTNLWLSGDDVYTSVSLPFAFHFYDNIFDTVYLSSNGWLSFTNPYLWQYHPPEFPSDDPAYHYVIAPFWDDMRAHSNVFAWLTPTHAVIEFVGYWSIRRYEIGTFQVVLFPNGTIDFNYMSMYGTEWATVGLNYGVDDSYHCSYPAADLEGVTNFTLQFTPIGGSHELRVALQSVYDWTMDFGTQHCVVLNQPQTLNVTVTNLGTTDEPNIDFRLYINDLLVTSEVIPLLNSQHLYAINYTWTPNILGTYNITAYVVPLSGEFTETNNQASRWVDCVIVHDYLVTQTPSSIWYDAVANGYKLSKSSWLTFEAVSLPFAFPFYDKTFDKVYASVNGWLSFTNDDPWYYWSSLFPNDLPEYDYVISPFWEGLSEGSEIYVWSTAHWVVIQYNNYHYSDGTPLGTFEVVLHADGLIEFHYQELLAIADSDAVVGLNHGNGIHSTNVPLSWLDDPAGISLSFTYQAPHDLTVSAGVPYHLEFGDPLLINATLHNRGMTTETNLDLFLYVDEALVATATIPQLSAGSTYIHPVLWTPTTVGTYNITVYVPAVLNENRTGNNLQTVLCTCADTQPPSWVIAPTNQLLLSGQRLFLQLNATDPSGITYWTLNNYYYFTIDATGLLTSTPLPIGIYTLIITVTDPYDNTRSATITVTVSASPALPVLIIAILSATTMLLALVGERLKAPAKQE